MFIIYLTEHFDIIFNTLFKDFFKVFFFTISMKKPNHFITFVVSHTTGIYIHFLVAPTTVRRFTGTASYFGVNYFWPLNWIL